MMSGENRLSFGVARYFPADDMKEALRLINRLQIEAINTAIDIDPDSVEISPDCLAIHNEATKFIESHRDEHAQKLVVVSFGDQLIPCQCIMVPAAMPIGNITKIVEEIKVQVLGEGLGADDFRGVFAKKGLHLVKAEQVEVA